jgi:hypothetical protein
MVYKPTCKRKAISSNFSPLQLCNESLEFVFEFKYLGHIIDNTFCDDSDINREIRNLFLTTNILIKTV